MDASAIGIFVPILAIPSGCALGAFSMWAGVKRREMVHRERLAMIERGLVPPGEPPAQGTPRRSLRLGVILIGLGVGLAMLIALSPNGEAAWEGIGVGGLLVCLGAAFVVNGIMDRRANPEPRTLNPELDRAPEQAPSPKPATCSAAKFAVPHTPGVKRS